MFTRPASFQEFLSRNNYIDEIYDAMAKDDHSEVVMTALNVLKKTYNLPPLHSKDKSTEVSVGFRKEGNNAFKTNNYQASLMLYNQALLFAPKDSKEMILAYSNRSALFFKFKQWSACKNDIDKCFGMDCPVDIIEKLKKRKKEADFFADQMMMLKNALLHGAKNILNYNKLGNNLHIPCAGNDIKVVGPTKTHRIVAAKEIKIGSVIASESAYVSYTDSNNQLFSCHYCQRKEFNLIPCDGCCYALFCDENCKIKCLTEYHNYECKIMDAIKNLCFGPMPNLMVKACLKLKSLCKSWKELISASYITGIKRIESSSVKEIYDANQIYSILTFRDERPFVYGVLYNASFVCAAIIHYIEEQIPSFFPKDVGEKRQALHAISRIMIYLSVHEIALHIVQAHTNVVLDKNNYGKENFGLFTFTGKLKNVCNPNLIIANHNNKLVTVALRPIEHGEELTVAHLWHRLDSDLDAHRNIKTFHYYGTVCKCLNCINDHKRKEKELTAFQKEYYNRLNMKDIDAKLGYILLTDVFSSLLKAMEVLKDVQWSKEYAAIYKRFRECIFFFDIVYGDNKVLA